MIFRYGKVRSLNNYYYPYRKYARLLSPTTTWQYHPNVRDDASQPLYPLPNTNMIVYTLHHQTRISFRVVELLTTRTKHRTMNPVQQQMLVGWLELGNPDGCHGRGLHMPCGEERHVNHKVDYMLEYFSNWE